GVEAVRKMVRVLQRSHVAITPDGPRGPRRRLQPGVISLSSMTGIPIVPNGFAYSAAWRLRTWDRLALPKPCSEVIHVSGDPIHIPSELDKEQLEMYRQRVENAMVEVTEAAEHLLNRSLSAVPTRIAPSDASRRAA